MSTDIKIPAVGESITSGVLAKWLHKSGDPVKAGDPLLVLETDKVSTEIAAERGGVLETLVEEGREVKIGEVVGRIEEHTAAPAPQEPPPATAEAGPASRVESEDGHSPAVRRMLEEENIPAGEVEGSGKAGRITKEDLVAYLKMRESKRGGGAGSGEPVAGQTAPAKPEPARTDDRQMQVAPEWASHAIAITTRRRLSPLRRKIAQQLVNAQNQAAILTTFNECDMSAIRSVRVRMQESFQRRHGIKLGFMSFFVKAVVNALKEVPSINARIEGEDVIENHFYDIGVAVGTARGLVVPVVREADRKSFAEIERDLADYATKAHEGKLQIEDLRGGVFTISNGGVYGSLLSTPILNPPQSGILGMHAIKDRPVVVDGQIVARPMMYLALSYDHRLVDGREAVTFLVSVKEAIEDPMQLVL